MAHVALEVHIEASSEVSPRMGRSVGLSTDIKGDPPSPFIVAGRSVKPLLIDESKFTTENKAG